MITNLVSWEAVRMMLPELLVVLAITLGIIFDFTMSGLVRAVAIRSVSLAAVIGATLITLGYMLPIQGFIDFIGMSNSPLPLQVGLMDGAFVVWPLSLIGKLIILIAVGLIILVGRERAEFYYLLLSATLGAMFLVSTFDLVTLFVGLELLSITSYIMVALKRQSGSATEAALKYIVMGGISSALILYGMSFIYGMSGSLNILQIPAGIQMAGADAVQPLLYLSFLLIIAGIGFKIASAPFHVWAPDVYQGSNTPTTAFLAVVSKAAGFLLLFPLLFNIYYQQEGVPSDTFHLILKVIAGLAMLIGNIMAIRQSDVKRLLAYSGIANTGYLLLPLTFRITDVHLVEFFYYLIAYVIMNLGVFAVIMHLQLNNKQQDESNASAALSTFAGLYHRAPATAIATVVLILSLAGLPLTGGFMGKWFILFGVFQEHSYTLAAILLGTTVLSFYYYFGIIRQMFMRSGSDTDLISKRFTMQLGTWSCVAATIVLGIFPSPVFEWILKIINPQ